MTGPAARVKLEDVIEGLERQSDEMNAYLHRPTCEILFLSDDILWDAEHGIGDDAADWYKDEIARAKAFREHEDEYIALPDRREVNEYGMMTEFAESLEDTDKGDELLLGLRGRGAFGRFNGLIRHFGIEKDWYAFRDKRYVEFAKQWCEDLGIDYEPPEE